MSDTLDRTRSHDTLAPSALGVRAVSGFAWSRIRGAMMTAIDIERSATTSRERDARIDAIAARCEKDIDELLTLPNKPLSCLAVEVNAINRANGWEVLTPDEWPDVRKVITALALVTTEVAEAIEAVRNDDRTNFAEEMADTVIRCLDICGGLGVDLDAEVAAKLEKNRNRGHRHGGKRV